MLQLSLDVPVCPRTVNVYNGLPAREWCVVNVYNGLCACAKAIVNSYNDLSAGSPS